MDNKKRTVILCESYASILYVLYRLAQETADVRITIFIPTLKDLYLLFQAINEKVFSNGLSLIYYPPYEARWKNAKGIMKLLYLAVDMVKERRYLRDFYNTHFARLEGAEIYFPSPGYSGAKIHIIRRLAKKNRLIFIDPGPPYMTCYPPRNTREAGTLLMYRAVYGKDICLGQFPAENPWSKGFPLMSDGFMKKAVDSSIDWANRNEIMRDFDWEKFQIYDTGDIRVLYFHQDFVGRYVPDRDTFKRDLKNIFDVVLRHYPEKAIARKYHPAHERNKDVIEVGEEIPIYIPAEFLYSDKIQIYLGISSTAIANVSGGQAISLLYLISFEPADLRERFRERLVSSTHSEVLFPSTLEELDRMIADIVKQHDKNG